MATAAEPILASSILTAYALTDAADGERPRKRQRLDSRCNSIDKALNGGLDYGAITCISAESDSGSRELTQALLASHLSSSESGEATVIDTTNSSDIRGLYERLKRLLQHSDATGGNEDRGAQAKRLLGRLKIMPAFDFIGVTEGVDELRQTLEKPVGTGLATAQPVSHPKGTIGDSQDDEKEEMLDEPSSPVTKNNGTSIASASPIKGEKGLLIIDSLSHVTLPILKSNHVQGQALLVSLMRSLHHLTRTHNLCTLMLNATTSYTKAALEDAPSISFSCNLRPALGKSFIHLLDTHLLMHRLPRGAGDAKAVYSENAVDVRGTASWVNVVEVLQDRNGDRVGRWAAFTTNRDGDLQELS